MYLPKHKKITIEININELTDFIRLPVISSQSDFATVISSQMITVTGGILNTEKTE